MRMQQIRVASSDSEVHSPHLLQAYSNALLTTFGNMSVGIRAADIADVFCTTKGVTGLINAIEVSLDEVCLLDPKAKRELSPEDAFTNSLFGVTNCDQGDLR